MPIDFGNSGSQRLTNKNTDMLFKETAGPIPIEFGDSGSHRWTNRNTDILREETAGPIPIKFGNVILARRD